MNEQPNDQNQPYADQQTYQTPPDQAYQNPYQSPYQNPYQDPYQNPYQQQTYQAPPYQQQPYQQQPYQQPYQQNPYQQQPYGQPAYAQTTYGNAQGAQYPMSDTDRTLRLIAFILNILSLVAVAALIIPLAWMIPMCVRSWGIYKGTKPNTVAFGICTLIFLDVISGILLLCSHKDD